MANLLSDDSFGFLEGYRIIMKGIGHEVALYHVSLTKFSLSHR